MCLIIHKPESKLIPAALLTDAYTRNSDGWGIMFVDNGEVQAIKGFSLDELIRHVELIQGGRQIFVHLRMRTDGAVNIQNCHPFQVGSSGVYMMHNGIIDIETYGGKSDTAVFVDMITPILESNRDLVFDTGFTSLVHEYIGHSRVVFLHPNGKYNIITDSAWVEWEGLSLSNRYAWSLHRKISTLPAVKTEYFAPVKSSLVGTPTTAQQQDVNQEEAWAEWWNSRTVTPSRIEIPSDNDIEVWASEVNQPEAEYESVRVELQGLDLDYTLDELVELPYHRLKELGKTPEILINAIYEAGKVK